MNWSTNSHARKVVCHFLFLRHRCLAQYAWRALQKRPCETHNAIYWLDPSVAKAHYRRIINFPRSNESGALPTQVYILIRLSYKSSSSSKMLRKRGLKCIRDKEISLRFVGSVRKEAYSITMSREDYILCHSDTSLHLDRLGVTPPFTLCPGKTELNMNLVKPQTPLVDLPEAFLKRRGTYARIISQFSMLGVRNDPCIKQLKSNAICENSGR